MNVSYPPPSVVAVSGGIDSVVLLRRLVDQNENVVVAHVDHGIRANSADDAVFVRELAELYQLPFETIKLKLGVRASEETARKARYAWLEQVKNKHNATSVITAHHQDDIIETMFINLVRGTSWRGLCSLRETTSHRRPLLTWSKAEIVEYALKHDLEWREDETNDSFLYLRNRIRHSIVPRLSSDQRQQLIALHTTQLSLRECIEAETATLHHRYVQDGQLKRYPLIMIDSRSAREILRSWLGESLETKRLKDLYDFAKTARNGAKWPIDGRRFVQANKSSLIVLSPRD